MDWNAISAIADSIAAIAVLVTLAYVSMQISQAKEQINLAGQRHRADAAREVLLSVSDSPELAHALAKLGGFSWGDYGLDEMRENVEVTAWCHAWMRTEEMNFRMNSPVQRATQDQLLKMWLSVPWAAKFWAENKAIYDVDFVTKMDGLHYELSRSSLAKPAEMSA